LIGIAISWLAINIHILCKSLLSGAASKIESAPALPKSYPSNEA